MEFYQFSSPGTHLVTRLWQNITFAAFWYISGQNGQDPADPTFEINGHGASVWCHCNVIHIKGWNLNNLAHRNMHLVTRLYLYTTFRIFGINQCKTCNTCCPTLEINGHGASVSCHSNYVDIKGWNMINLAHRELIWLRVCDTTSLFRIIGIYIYTKKPKKWCFVTAA